MLIWGGRSLTSTNVQFPYVAERIRRVCQNFNSNIGTCLSPGTSTVHKAAGYNHCPPRHAINITSTHRGGNLIPCGIAMLNTTSYPCISHHLHQFYLTEFRIVFWLPKPQQPLTAYDTLWKERYPSSWPAWSQSTVTTALSPTAP